MSTPRSHRELAVWGKGMDLVEEVYRLSRALPATERFGLTSQMLRAAVSIPANIAEGNARETRRDYAHFVTIARGSAMELETLIRLAERLHHLHPTQTHASLTLTDELSRMLLALRRRLNP